MAVVPLSANEKIVLTMSATPGVATELYLHKNARTLNVQGYDATGTVATAAFIADIGTDGAAIDPTRKTIDAGALLREPVATRARNLEGTTRFIASSVAGGKVEVATSSIPI